MIGAASLLVMGLMALFYSAATRSLWSPKRVMALELIRRTETGKCDLLALRDSQPVRRLADGVTHAVKVPTRDGEWWTVYT